MAEHASERCRGRASVNRPVATVVAIQGRFQRCQDMTWVCYTAHRAVHQESGQHLPASASPPAERRLDPKLASGQTE